MKKAYLLLLLVFVLLFAGCDEEFRIIKLEIGSLPDRLVYIADVDDVLYFEGGTCIWTNKKGEIGEEQMTYWGIKHDVNFNQPGIYAVDICINEKPYCSYQVMVISQKEAQLLSTLCKNE